MNAAMLVLGAAPVGTLLVTAGGVVLGLMLVAYGLRGRALRLRRAEAAEMSEEDPRMRAMEARVSRLETLLERSRGEIAELKQLAAGEAGGAANRDGVRAHAERVTQAARGLHAGNLNLVGSERPVREAARPEPKPRGMAGEVALDPDFAGIYALADAGLSAAEIAAKVQRPTGQVELILNLRRHGIGA